MTELLQRSLRGGMSRDVALENTLRFGNSSIPASSESWLKEASSKSVSPKPLSPNTYCPLPATALDPLLVLHSQSMIRLRAEAKLQRCGREVCLLIPAPGGDRKVQRRPAPSLIKAVARAHNWYQRLSQRRSSELPIHRECRRLAGLLCFQGSPFRIPRPGHRRSHSRRNAAASPTLAKMASGIPLSWAEQRERFGFPGCRG